MADRIEREIEEILAKLDQDEGLPGGNKKPVSILSAKTKRQAPPSRGPRTSPVARVNPTTFLFAGAGLVIAGLFLSSFWEPLIWASLAGVVVFLGAFASSFFRSGTPPPGAPRGVYWRDRYIEYEPPRRGGGWRRFARRFRR